MGFFTAFTAWYQKYGYTSDPLSIKPTTNLIAREKEIKSLSENLVSGNIALLQGEAGLGKTSILRAAEQNFRGDGEFSVHYVSLLDGFEEIKKICSDPGLIESLLIRVGLKKKKKAILLVDEGQLMLFSQAESLRNLFDCDSIHSLVLACGEKNNLNLSLSFRRRIGEQLMLPKLSTAELKELLKARLSKVNPLQEETVDYLAKISDGNPRQFLINCKKVCIRVHEFFEGEASVNLGKAKEIVAKKYNSVINEKTAAPEKKNVLENLTPLQKAILEQLNQSPMGLGELSESTGSSIGTIGKQISLLSLKTKKEYMERKGVKEPLIKKDKDQTITIYHLTGRAEKLLNNTRLDFVD